MENFEVEELKFSLDEDLPLSIGVALNADMGGGSSIDEKSELSKVDIERHTHQSNSGLLLSVKSIDILSRSMLA